MSMRRISIFVDHLLKRDRYLDDLNRRIDHFADIESSPTARVIDGVEEATHRPDFSLPEIDAAEFSLDFLKQSMRESGCCLVRNYFSDNEVEELRDYVDHSFAVHRGDSFVHNYLAKQIDLRDVLKKTRNDIEANRELNDTYTDTIKLGPNLTRTLGADVSCLTATSPILTDRLLHVFERKGLKAMLGEYFGSEPCVSVYKWVLRKATSPQQPIDFHQDGAFMGEYIDSLNCWAPLTDCGEGTDVPGMDIVPVRFLSTFEKGTGVLNWTVSPQAVTDRFGEEAVITPAFRRGDAFFFDHCLVHRTQHVPDALSERYAIETWFFDSTSFPKNQIPIQW